MAFENKNSLLGWWNLPT